MCAIAGHVSAISSIAILVPRLHAIRNLLLPPIHAYHIGLDKLPLVEHPCLRLGTPIPTTARGSRPTSRTMKAAEARRQANLRRCRGLSSHLCNTCHLRPRRSPRPSAIGCDPPRSSNLQSRSPRLIRRRPHRSVLLQIRGQRAAPPDACHASVS
ncbi:hypothetical protein PsYK624_136260 [Phanerochaete sordida]|uniref:Uncharacterized protein n=1 Tax=Phanerochaete sordida TaxID=48140 RepID=A0A9P3GND0_9APHY|nr:hypothetical protein PsYK624_136260 [Phanerochaete sordida]